MTSSRCSGCPSVRVARSKCASPWRRLGPVDDAGHTRRPSTKTWSTCRSPWMNTGLHGRRASLGKPTVACDHVGGEDIVGDEPLALAGEVRRELVDGSAGPGRQRRVVKRPDGGTRRCPCGRRCVRRLAEVAEGRSPDRGECEHGRLAPQDLRGRDRHDRHRLDLDGRCATDRRRSSGTHRRRGVSRDRCWLGRPRPASRPHHREDDHLRRRRRLADARSACRPS